MSISSKKEYLILAGLSVLMLVIVPFNEFFRILIIFPYVLFIPGYLVTAVLFPKTGDLENLNRISLSVGLSIIIVPLIGLLQNWLPWGITLLPMMLSLTLFDAVLMVLGWSRRRKLPEEQRFTLAFNINIEKLKIKFKSNKIIYSILLTIVLTIVTALIFMLIFPPKAGKCFTEFYITGKNGTVAGLPKQLQVGAEEAVTVTVINNEYQKTVYRIEIRLDGKVIQSISDISLKNNEKWENVVSIKADKASSPAKVEFLLFRNKDTAPYRQLRLWVDVYY